jgi:hypothetical protein
MGKILHASASGYFPNCIKIGPRDEPTQSLPFTGFTDMTLDQAMGLLWRVKTWECLVSGSSEYLPPEGPGASYITTFTDTTYREMFTFTPINQEEDLVCGIQFQYRLDDIPALFTFLDGSMNIPQTCKFYIGSNDISKVGDVYFPTLSTNCWSFSSIGSVGEFSQAIGTYNISFLGYVITRTTYNGIYVFGSQTINIRAKEYWSYGGTYDTATGEPL